MEGQSPAWASPSGLVLITSLLVGGFALLSSVLVLASPLSNAKEWTLFVLTLAVLSPVVIAGGLWLTRTVEANAGRSGLAELATIAAVGILAIVVAGRSSYALGHRSSTAMLLLGIAWAAVVAVVARRQAMTGERVLAPDLIDPTDTRTALALAALAGLCLLAFFPGHFFHPDQVAVSLVLAAALLAVHLRRLAVPRWAVLLLDVCVIVFVVAIVTDVSGYQEYLRGDARTYIAGDDNPIPPHDLVILQRHHQDFFLGPLNDMLHGRPLLVDTSSQYGAGIFYLLAGFFQIAPLGYGALGLIASFLTGLQFAVAYGVLRLARVPRTLAIPAIIAAVLGLVLGSLGSYNDFPSNGGLRFGIPWIVIAAVVLAARQPNRAKAWWATATVLVACTAIWSFETFAYAGAVYAAAAALDAATRDRATRLRAFVRSIATVLAACVAAHVLFALATRAFAGAWPDWSTYLEYLNVYSAQSELLGTTVPWPPALPMLLVHLTSLIALAALVARDHPLLGERRAALIAIAACNGLGLASFSYWVGLSLQNALFLLGLPVVVVAGLWLSVAEDVRARLPRALTIGVLAVGLWFAATLAISGWHDTKDKWRRTALAHVVPGTGDDTSLPDALSRIWHNPVSDPRAPTAQRLLDRHFAPGTRALVLMEPDLTVETLVRSDRINVLPISQPIQDNLVPDHVDPKVIATVATLRPGTLMLTQPATWDAPLTASPVNVANGLVRVQRLALDRIRARFDLKIIDRGPDGLAIVRLVAKR